jgi:hypothetical protein
MHTYIHACMKAQFGCVPSSASFARLHQQKCGFKRIGRTQQQCVIDKACTSKQVYV